MAFKRLDNTTISKYMNKALDGAAEKRPTFGILKRKGHIKGGCSGLDIDTPVEGGKYTMTGHNDGETITYTRKNHHERAVFPWAEYQINDYITDGERLKNRGKEALVETEKNMVRRMRDHFEEELGKEFLTKDGVAETSFNALYGLESFAGGSYSSGKESTPSDTYAGLSTTADAATDIDGQLSDFWTPTLVAWNKDVWGNTSANVSDNILNALKYGIVEGTKGSSKKEMLDCILLSSTDYFNMLEKYEDKEEIQVVKGAGQAVADLGFPSIRYFGLEVTFDTDLSSGTGWGLNFDHIWFYLLNEGKDLFQVVQDYNSEKLAHTLAMVLRGQLVMQPKYQVKFVSA